MAHLEALEESLIICPKSGMWELVDQSPVLRRLGDSLIILLFTLV